MLKYLGFNSYPCLNWAWGCMLVIQALGKWLEEDEKSEVNELDANLEPTRPCHQINRNKHNYKKKSVNS